MVIYVFLCGIIENKEAKENNLINNMIHEERTYRSLINKDNLTSYNVKIGESDLFISSDSKLTDVALKSLSKHRNSLEAYIKNHPEFRTSLLPLQEDNLAPLIIREMLAKSKICRVGPMASVAGAISEFVGYDLIDLTENLIIEKRRRCFSKVQKQINRFHLRRSFCFKL